MNVKKVLVFVVACIISLSVSGQEVIKGNESDIVITPVIHASMVIEWDGLTILIDPYDGGGRYSSFEPDLILITHEHGDHFDPGTLSDLNFEEAMVIAPAIVVKQMDTLEFLNKKILNNGEKTKFQRISIEAVPMYNLSEENPWHKKGVGNGYVLQIDGKQIYISGDTEGIPEMRKLENIDAAFVCMNLPYTMDVDQAADAVSDFRPKVVYPYHYRGKDGFSDIEHFKKLVNKRSPEVEVRLLDWYQEKE